jgi:hypothetical protein
MEPDMGAVERVTPQGLLDIFWMLPNEERKEFLRLLGDSSPADVPFLIALGLEKTEVARFVEMVYFQIFPRIVPIVIQHGIQLLRENPAAPTEELQREIEARIAEYHTEYDQVIGKRERAALKAKRDRKSDAATVTRNLEICNLRQHNRRHWSYAALAKKYGGTPQNIKKILDNEPKWRREAARISTD